MEKITCRRRKRRKTKSRVFTTINKNRARKGRRGRRFPVALIAKLVLPMLLDGLNK